MEDCKICFSNKSNRMLPCSHSLCSMCCVKLNIPVCPYCRQTFIYTADEIKERIKLGILNGYKKETAPGFAFRPQDWIEHRQLNNYIIIDDQIIHEPLSRARKSMHRNRRRTLSLDEVLERRRMIQEKKERHWERKNARLVKINWWEN